ASKLLDLRSAGIPGGPVVAVRLILGDPQLETIAGVVTRVPVQGGERQGGQKPPGDGQTRPGKQRRESRERTHRASSVYFVRDRNRGPSRSGSLLVVASFMARRPVDSAQPQVAMQIGIPISMKHNGNPIKSTTNCKIPSTVRPATIDPNPGRTRFN